MEYVVYFKGSTYIEANSIAEAEEKFNTGDYIELEADATAIVENNLLQEAYRRKEVTDK